jgi:hypothetical protein
MSAGGMVTDAMGDSFRKMTADRSGGENNDYFKDKLQGDKKS